MKKKYISLISIAAMLCLSAFTSSAGFGGYAPWTILCTTNAPNYVTNYVYVQLPSVAFTATATNSTTRTTNYIVQSFNPAGGQFTISVSNTFVYDASIYGTNFSTNFPAISIATPVCTGFQSVPALSTGTASQTVN